MNWIHQYYKQSSRKVYRFLRHPRRRRQSRLQNWLAERVFDKELWRPKRETVAKGLATGLFLALIPIPVQMLVGVAIASTKRWNIPATVLGVWLTNPFTLWLYYFPYKLGMEIFAAFGVNVAGGRNVMLNMASADTLLSVQNVSEAFTTAQAWLLGCIITGSVVAAIGYALVYFLWDVVTHVRAPQPVATSKSTKVKPA